CGWETRLTSPTGNGCSTSIASRLTRRGACRTRAQQETQQSDDDEGKRRTFAQEIVNHPNAPSPLLKHRGALPVGHRLRTSMQRWIAAVKDGTLDGIIIQDLLRILERGEPHAQMLKIGA